MVNSILLRQKQKALNGYDLSLYKWDFQHCYGTKDKEGIIKCCLMVYIFLRVHRFSMYSMKEKCVSLQLDSTKIESLHNYRPHKQYRFID